MPSHTAKILLFILPVVLYQLNLTVLQILISSSALFAVVIIIDNRSDGGYRLPPGPMGLPVIGSLLSMMFYDVDDYFFELSKVYGNMFTVKTGNVTNVVINDHETMKEFTNNPDFQGRVKNSMSRYITGDYGVISSEGSLWKHQRRFMLQSLRDSGMGKIKMEEKITNEAEAVISEIAKSNGRPMSLHVLLEKATCNVIFGLALNKSFDYDDPTLNGLIDKMNEFIFLAGKLFIVFVFDGLRIFFKKQIKTFAESVSYILKEADNNIVEHRENFDEDNPRDYIDLFMTEAKKDVDSNNRDYMSTFTEKQLQSVIFDVFLAGTETSSTTLRWAILYMIIHPEIQKKVQKEIDEVTGGNRAPTMADKPNLPFTIAALQEAERLGSIVTKGVPRCNPEPAKFREFFFPKRTVFMLNIYAIHRDPKLWNSPEEYKPERFIDNEGNVFRPPYLVPFGSGKRSCAGETLAKMEIYLFFATLMHKFTFSPPNGNCPNDKPTVGSVRGPAYFEVVAKPRN